MSISAFGVDHGDVSKSDALGSTESILGIAHDRGEHKDTSFRRCPKCNKGAFGAAQKRPPIPKTVRAVGGAMKAAR